jgi:IS605 OrfB family transposase
MPQQILTIVCQLNPTAEQIVKLDQVLQGFAEACRYINSTICPSITNKNRIQKEVYRAVRQQFGLTANLAVRACARVAANRKVGKVKEFRATSVDYDARIFNYREKEQCVSLSALDGRERIPLVVGNYQIEKLKGKKPTSATLCKRKDGKFYIHIQVKEEVPEPQTGHGVLGVDFGRTDIAHTSEGDNWHGQQLQSFQRFWGMGELSIHRWKGFELYPVINKKTVTKVRDHYSKLRAVLQHKARKGTRSSRRRCRELVKRLSGRERRFQAWVNHCISKTIVARAKATGSVIALEDLTGIRERTNQVPRSKTERRRANSWAFYQLRSFISYKALQAGVGIVLVNPRYSSQTCHRCLHIHPDPAQSYRSGKSFKCEHCGWEGDADLNGASVIALLGAVVNQPRGPGLFCSLVEHNRLRATESP